MREKIAGKVFAWLSRSEEERIVYELVDEVTKVIGEEIERVENPFKHILLGDTLYDVATDVGFERCRKKILSMLKD